MVRGHSGLRTRCTMLTLALSLPDLHRTPAYFRGFSEIRDLTLRPISQSHDTCPSEIESRRSKQWKRSRLLVCQSHLCCWHWLSYPGHFAAARSSCCTAASTWPFCVLSSPVRCSLSSRSTRLFGSLRSLPRRPVEISGYGGY